MSRTVPSRLRQRRMLLVCMLPIAANATIITNTTCNVSQGVTQSLTTTGVNLCTATLPTPRRLQP